MTPQEPCIGFDVYALMEAAEALMSKHDEALRDPKVRQDIELTLSRLKKRMEEVRQ